MAAQELTSLPFEKSNPLRPAILLLHGSGGNVDFWTTQLGSALASAGIQLYAPHYFDRTGTRRADQSTISDGVHVPQWLQTLDDALRFVASRPSVNPRRILLAGVSLGAFLAMALAARLSADPDPASATRIRGIVEVSGGLVPPYDGLASKRLPPTLVIHGSADTVVPVSFALELATRLAALDIPHESLILQGEGHWFSAAAWPMMLQSISAFAQPLLS